MYLFIIWKKALFCKDRILKDLSNSFNIVTSFYINWNDDNYENNLYNFYGPKMNDVKEKIHYAGKGEFYIIIVEDKNPKYITIKQYDKEEIVNENILEKKNLYRKWTGESFRIHASLNEEESKHDLSILLSHDYLNVINQIEKDSHILLDTTNITGFNPKKDSFREVKKLSLKEKVKKEIKYIIARIKYR